MKLLVTGATGYIGSHFCALAMQNHHELIMVDDLSSSSIKTLDAIQALTKIKCNFVQLDLCDEQSVDQLISTNQGIDAVIHFAAKKSVAESILDPVKYYNNNVLAGFFLLKALQKYNINKFVFSSTAAVYIDAAHKPFTETMSSIKGSPYSNSKLIFETILNDYCNAEKKFAAISLRYFNVAGAHPSGLIGESLSKSSGNLFPELFKVVTRQNEYLNIFGNDYPTPDGTAIRDYIHVMDLVQGHLNALHYLDSHPGFDVFNLGRGEGCSVLNLVNTLEKEINVKVPHQFKPRRPGDSCSVIADATKANRLLDWQAKYTIKDMIHDAWQYSNQA